MNDKKMLALRMERQCLAAPADEAEYLALYQDCQPGQNVYWNGFGQPPTLSFRAAFDDLEFNRCRQVRRELIKGRFAGGNLGWIVPEDLELFAALYRKPLTKPTEVQLALLDMIEREGPVTIQQLKEETGLLVKALTPALHRLQEAFLIYEDQNDGQWDRGWYPFREMFPQADLERFTRQEALERVLLRFARRMVWFDSGMAKSFYRLPEKEIKRAAESLTDKGALSTWGTGYVLAQDRELLTNLPAEPPRSVYAIHRNDILYKTQEPALKELVKPLTEGLAYDHEPLQYLLVDGEFCGAVVGHFRNGPYDLNDVVCSLPDARERREELLDAVRAVNFGKGPQRFLGEAL